MGSKSQSRGSSPKPSSRRPKLMRAAATAPSLATSNASRKDLASLQSSRAATLLSRVASYSMAHHGHHGTTGSICSRPDQRSPESASMEGRKESFETAIHQSGNYFSFPSFDDFQEFQENEESMAAMHDKVVP